MRKTRKMRTLRIRRTLRGRHKLRGWKRGVGRLLVISGLAALSFLTANASKADETNNSSLGLSRGSSSSGETRPFTLFGSIGSGYGVVSGNDYAQSPSGTHVLLSLLGATQITHWEFDGGVSWLYSSINGQSSGGVPISVRTRAGTVDLGARYRIGQHWQLGPALNLAFGTDTSFGSSVGSAQAELLLGAKALYEIPNLAFPIRLWAQFSTDTAVDQHLYVGLVGVQLGIPIHLPKSSASERTIVERDVVASSSAAPDRRVKVVLDSQKVFFGTMSASLRPGMISVLKEVGQYLGTPSGDPSEIKVAGHADQRGRFAYNLKLSKKRAESVSQALAAGGVDPHAMDVEAFSYLAPLDPHNNPAAWAKNRRVEITFENVKDPEGLRKLLAPLSSQAPLPSPRDKEELKPTEPTGERKS